MFGADDVASNAPLADCNGNHSWKNCVFMDFDKRLSGLQALHANDFDGNVVFVFSIRSLRAVYAKRMNQKFRSLASEDSMSKQSGLFVFSYVNGLC